MQQTIGSEEQRLMHGSEVRSKTRALNNVLRLEERSQNMKIEKGGGEVTEQITKLQIRPVQ